MSARVVEFTTPGPVTTDDEQAFRQHATGLANRQGRLLTLLILTAAVAFWPVDLWAMAGQPDLLAASRTWRVGMIALVPPTYAALHLARDRWLATLLVEFVAGIAALSIVSLAFGRVSHAWFPFFFIVPFSTVHLSVPLRIRIVMTTLACLTVTVVFHLAGNQQDYTRANLQIGIAFMAFCCATACFLGHTSYLLARANFFHARLLEQRVAEKTVELRELLEHLARGREAERGYLGRELHDEMGSLFAAMRYEVERLAAGAHNRAGEAAVFGLIDRALQTVRAIVADLRPRSLDELGFSAAVAEQFDGFEARTGIACLWFIEPPEIDLAGDRALAVFRVLQESLTNVARHSGATCVEVHIEASTDGSTLDVTVADNGHGIRETGRKGFGLIGMRERVQAFGGRLEIGPAPGGGMKVHVRLPMRDEWRVERGLSTG